MTLAAFVACSVIFAGAAWFLAYHRANGLAWSFWLAAGVAALHLTGAMHPAAVVLLWALVAVFALFTIVIPVRRAVVTGPIFGLYKKVLPQISQTEQEALDAGSIWWDADLFTGKPDWKKLLAYPQAKLSAEERPSSRARRGALRDAARVGHHPQPHGPPAGRVEVHPREGLPRHHHPEVVRRPRILRIRAHRDRHQDFDPQRHGGGDGDGPEFPRPRRAPHPLRDRRAEELLPAAARQGPRDPVLRAHESEAGSDAGAIPDFGIVCKGMHEGREVLGIRLTWEKRYITLGPVATILGLAFKLFDPQKLIGDKEECGVTLALIPTSHKGVNIGRRHIPLNTAFMNGPNSGKDVFIPMDWVIGGQKEVGHGWKMLVECLAAGRSISLPSMSMAAGKLGSRATGAYARIRTQFRTPIGRFEGVEEPLARIGGYTYMMDATRRLTMAALDMGEKPSVISAICKYHMTERMRQIVNDAMDIHGGKGIMLGPNNMFGRAYQTVPIAITVEGANILTRSMIIFGRARSAATRSC
jgi:acyl-CoA dehydrogenase